MLHVLQYLVGTSIAAVVELPDLIIVQSVVGGASLNRSSFGSGGGIGCRFLGMICCCQKVRTAERE